MSRVDCTPHCRITLRSVRIPGQLDLTETRLSNPDGLALRVSSAVIGEMWLHGAAPIEGTVNLRGTQLQLLYAEPAVWPEQVRLGELTHTTLLPHLPAADRLPLIDFGQERAYAPHGWCQWLSYALIISGWLLVTTIAAGITRAISRS